MILKGGATVPKIAMSSYAMDESPCVEDSG
jgi:hypothetical protein